MKIKLGNGLIPQNLFVVILIILTISAPSIISRIILGLLLVLFFPGYSLVLALLPRQNRIGNTKRIALSFGLSIAVVPLIGLFLNYTPQGITLYSALYSVTGFIFTMSLIAWLRLRRLEDSERFRIEFQINRPTGTKNKQRTALLATLIIFVVVSIGVLGYVLAMPKASEKFTDFYVLGPGGEAADYPTEISVKEEAAVILGIVNHEQESSSYRIEIVVDGTGYDEVGSVNLENDEKWESLVIFSANHVGEDQKIEFLLYRDGQMEAYNTIYLWINVR